MKDALKLVAEKEPGAACICICLTVVCMALSVIFVSWYGSGIFVRYMEVNAATEMHKHGVSSKEINAFLNTHTFDLPLAPA